MTLKDAINLLSLVALWVCFFSCKLSGAETWQAIVAGSIIGIYLLVMGAER